MKKNLCLKKELYLPLEKTLYKMLKNRVKIKNI